MNRKIRSQSAITLIELIVASVLVGIVMIGLIAAEQAIRMSRQSSSRDNRVSAQLQAAMLKLTKDASLTVGDAADTGIYQYAVGNDFTICFRQAYGDANTYTDDKWNCWWVNKTIVNFPYPWPSFYGLLTSCDGNANPVNACTGGVKQEWITIAGDQNYTTFFSVIDVNNNIVAPASAIITNTRISHIRLNLWSRFNTTAAANPIENPDYRLTANISPTGLSR